MPKSKINLSCNYKWFLFNFCLGLIYKNFNTSVALLAKLKGLENEPDAPIMKTTIPGPKSKELTGQLGNIQVD